MAKSPKPKKFSGAAPKRPKGGGKGKNYKRSREQVSNYHRYFGTSASGNASDIPD